jgi:hypothetical protein
MDRYRVFDVVRDHDANFNRFADFEFHLHSRG